MLLFYTFNKNVHNYNMYIKQNITCIRIVILIFLTHEIKVYPICLVCNFLCICKVKIKYYLYFIKNAIISILMHSINTKYVI